MIRKKVDKSRKVDSALRNQKWAKVLRTKQIKLIFQEA